MAFFGWLRHGKLRYAALAFGAAVCLRPLLALLLPFVLAFLAGAVAWDIAQLLILISALATPALLSLAPWLAGSSYATTSGAHAPPRIAQMLSTLLPPTQAASAAIAPPSEHSVWKVYETFVVGGSCECSKRGHKRVVPRKYKQW